MSNIKPLKLVDLGSGVGGLHEFSEGDNISVVAIGR